VIAISVSLREIQPKSVKYLSEKLKELFIPFNDDVFQNPTFEKIKSI
jgi:hypothetical protein